MEIPNLCKNCLNFVTLSGCKFFENQFTIQKRVVCDYFGISDISRFQHYSKYLLSFCYEKIDLIKKKRRFDSKNQDWLTGSGSYAIAF